MKNLRPIVCALALPALMAAAGLAARHAAPSIEGSYTLDFREMPDGSKLRPPQIVGMMTLTKDHRNFNIYWTEAGKPTSIAAIYHYTLSDKLFTEESLYYAANMAGAGITYETSSSAGTAPVTVKGDQIQFTLPLHGEPAVAFDKNGFTATRKDAFVDHWKKLD